MGYESSGSVGLMGLVVLVSLISLFGKVASDGLMILRDLQLSPMTNSSMISKKLPKVIVKMLFLGC